MPGEADTLVAAREDPAVHLTRRWDGWRPQARQPLGLLNWHQPEALYAIDLAGRVHRSSDAARSWRTLGKIGGRPAAFARHGDDLYVALHDNRVKVSSDGGAGDSARRSSAFAASGTDDSTVEAPQSETLENAVLTCSSSASERA
jgi:hypothetical protein